MKRKPVIFSLFLILLAYSALGSIESFLFFTDHSQCAALFVKKDTLITSKSCEKSFTREYLYLESTEGDFFEVSPKEIIKEVNGRSFILIKVTGELPELSGYPEIGSELAEELSQVHANEFGQIRITKLLLSDSNNVVVEQSLANKQVGIVKNGEAVSKALASYWRGLPLISKNIDTGKTIIHGVLDEQTITEGLYADLGFGEAGFINYKAFISHFLKSDKITGVESDRLLKNFVSKDDSLELLKGWLGPLLGSHSLPNENIDRIYKKEILTLYNL